MNLKVWWTAGASWLALCGAAAAQPHEPRIATDAAEGAGGDAIIVTARRVQEDLQDVPIPVTALREDFLIESGLYNAGRLREVVPSVQFYSTNPRNSAINIRGLGAPLGLTNDGIEQGVGLYVDGVYYARPAAATLDFLDVSQIEVLRGPQGTLYGKNTTAGAINVTTRAPAFTPEAELELTYGNYGFLQARGTVSGPLSEDIAARFTFSGTQRDGVLYNVATEDDLNDISNIGWRASVLWNVSEDVDVTLSADNTVARPEGYASVFAGVAPTQRPANRQYAAQAAFFSYAPPSTNEFDRVTDLDSPHRSYSDLGGASLTFNWDVGSGTLTAISAWRQWLWDPSNDRDFLGLPITTVSANPSKQYQWSQEIRYAGDISDSLSFVAGAFWFNQVTKTLGSQEQGPAAWRFLLNPNAAAATPGLLDGYGQRTEIRSDHTSAALFGQVEWSVTDNLRIIPGVRFNHDEKSGYYRANIYGGLQTSDPALIALQRSVLSPQSYQSTGDDENVSGQLTIAYELADTANLYATYSTSFKTFGLNNNGVPLDSGGNVAVQLATVLPEDTGHIEFGIKTRPLRGWTLNATAFETTINDFQVNVVNGQVGVIRGYLANADEVQVRGVEIDSAVRVSDDFSFYTNLAWTDGEFVSFTDAPPPLELSGGAIQVVDASGTRLPGLSEWAASVGGEFSQPGALLGRQGEYFLAADASYRSDFSSSATESDYLNIDSYSLLNARVGFRGENGWDVFVWGRNILDEDYFEILSAGGSSSGYYAGLPGDPRTYGVTLRTEF
ncbi:outer membrane receptor proteins, mostly Fe transport [alpha proteobacterium U9-1i]|nr:outer membrane receptor proteins, mostly Fe transport [alpha proteobacterium U9-1i]